MNSTSRLTTLTTGSIDSELIEMKRFYDFAEWVMEDVVDKSMLYEVPSYQFASDKTFTKVSISIMKTQIRDMIKAINKSNLVKGEIRAFVYSAKQRLVIDLSFNPVYPMAVVGDVKRDIDKMRRFLDQRIAASAAAPLSVAIAAQAQALAEISAEVEEEPSD
jgi:hypothetical protein